MNILRSTNKSFTYIVISAITLISFFSIANFSSAATMQTTGMAKFVALGSVVTVSPGSVIVNVRSANKGSNLKGNNKSFSIKSTTRVTKRGKIVKLLSLKTGTRVKVFGVTDKKTGENKVNWIKVIK